MIDQAFSRLLFNKPNSKQLLCWRKPADFLAKAKCTGELHGMWQAAMFVKCLKPPVKDEPHH